MNPLLISLTILSIFYIGAGYGKSKTWQDKLRFALIPISIAISIAFLYFIIGSWKFNNIGNLLEENLPSIWQLQIIPLFLIEYCLIASIAICFCAWKKKGFTNLKEFKFRRNNFQTAYRTAFRTDSPTAC